MNKEKRVNRGELVNKNIEHHCSAYATGIAGNSVMITQRDWEDLLAFESFRGGRTPSWGGGKTVVHLWTTDVKDEQGNLRYWPTQEEFEAIKERWEAEDKSREDAMTEDERQRKGHSVLFDLKERISRDFGENPERLPDGVRIDGRDWEPLLSYLDLMENGRDWGKESVKATALGVQLKSESGHDLYWPTQSGFDKLKAKWELPEIPKQYKKMTDDAVQIIGTLAQSVFAVSSEVGMDNIDIEAGNVRIRIESIEGVKEFNTQYSRVLRVIRHLGSIFKAGPEMTLKMMTVDMFDDLLQDAETLGQSFNLTEIPNKSTLKKVQERFRSDRERYIRDGIVVTDKEWKDIIEWAEDRETCHGWTSDKRTAQVCSQANMLDEAGNQRYWPTCT